MVILPSFGERYLSTVLFNNLWAKVHVFLALHFCLFLQLAPLRWKAKQGCAPAYYYYYYYAYPCRCCIQTPCKGCHQAWNVCGSILWHASLNNGEYSACRMPTRRARCRMNGGSTLAKRPQRRMSPSCSCTCFCLMCLCPRFIADSAQALFLCSCCPPPYGCTLEAICFRPRLLSPNDGICAQVCQPALHCEGDELSK